MKRRSFLAMLGLAPAAAVAAPMPKATVEAGDGLTMLDVKLGEYQPSPDVIPSPDIMTWASADDAGIIIGPYRIDALADDVRSHLEAARQEREELSRLVAELALD